MKKIALFFAILIAVLSLITCDLFITRITEHFGLDFQGTWKSTEPLYDGKLVFVYDEVTISGYTGVIGNADESTLPFAEFSKGIPLKGNSVTSGPLPQDNEYFGDTGTFTIKDGKVENKINYTYFKTKNSPQKRFLRVSYANWEDTLRPEDEND